MRFNDRADAGRQLAQQLLQYKDSPDVMVIALPRGGVVTGFEIAHTLGVPLDIVVPRKIGAPGQPELAVGALTEEGEPLLNELLMKKLGISTIDILSTIQEERKEAQRRLRLYRGDRKPLNLKDKTVILVDDGIATGSTMRAAIATVRVRGAKKIIVAVPVSSPEILNEIGQEVDSVICLHTPEVFWGVGAFYDRFAQTEDETVVELIDKAILG